MPRPLRAAGFIAINLLHSSCVPGVLSNAARTSAAEGGRYICADSGTRSDSWHS